MVVIAGFWLVTMGGVLWIFAWGVRPRETINRLKTATRAATYIFLIKVIPFLELDSRRPWQYNSQIPCARHEIGIESAPSQFRFDDSKLRLALYNGD